MKLKRVISVIVMFGFLSIFGLCLPKKCCKTEFEKNVEDIVRSYLRGKLNRKLLSDIYGEKLKEINMEENKGIAILQFDHECYKIGIRYLDLKSKNDDVIPESLSFYAKDGDEEALPLSVFFDLCEKEDYYEPRKAIPSASFKYIEGDSPYRISISVDDAFIYYKNIRNSSGRIIQLTRYPKSWDEEK